MLSQITFQPGLASTIRTEVASAFSGNEIDIDFVCNSCPVLNAVWLETLRLFASSTVLRILTRDTWIGGKLLEKGRTLIVPTRQLHLNETVFGGDVAQFRHTRFLENAQLRRHPSFRPFGGGATLCPGRLLAKRMVLAFVAMLLSRFDVTACEGQAFPRYESSKPTLGILDSIDDLVVQLQKRANV